MTSITDVPQFLSRLTPLNHAWCCEKSENVPVLQGMEIRSFNMLSKVTLKLQYRRIQSQFCRTPKPRAAFRKFKYDPSQATFSSPRMCVCGCVIGDSICMLSGDRKMGVDVGVALNKYFWSVDIFTEYF